jgi:hypothetical protein
MNVAEDSARDPIGADAHSSAPDGTSPLDSPSEQTGTGKPHVRVLSQVLKGGPWKSGQATQGIAADDSGRVFIGDKNNIYSVEGNTATVHISLEEAAVAPGTLFNFHDFDISPEGRLYMLLAAAFSDKGYVLRISRSSQAHEAEVWVDLPYAVASQYLAVIREGYLAVIQDERMWAVTAAGAKQVYDHDLFMLLDPCATRDLSADTTGQFLFQPGCARSGLLRGNIDGSGIAILYPLGTGSAIAASSFLCSARDPSGGFMVVVRDARDGAPKLYHIAADAQGPTGLDWIRTEPSFADAALSDDNADPSGFDFCSLAVAKNGTVYYQTFSQLWKVEP